MSFEKIATDTVVWLLRQWMRLPVPFLLSLGRGLGRIIYWLPNKRKHVAKVNIGLCFPEMQAEDSKQLLKANMIATGQGLIEQMMSLWCHHDRFVQHVSFSGLEHIQTDENGRAPILLTCHTTSIQFGVRCLNTRLNKPGHMLMRQDNNKVLEAHLTAARERYAEKVIDKKDMRTLLRSLAQGNPVYYAPDQNFSYNFEYIPFFGVDAATTVALAKLAHVKNIAVVPWFCFRTGTNTWHVEVLPRAEFFGAADYRQVLLDMHALFEQHIKKYPEQYLWVHRRFKTHPQGKNYLYK
ncbi:lysophospholipid acyltransferase family protein [Marinicella sp. W31]|uniref:lysophospholipid acyltransferase family protein n=1 Tax=Marinicella sp. W31 TaxID=3023713 RepID=UPI003756E767